MSDTNKPQFNPFVQVFNFKHDFSKEGRVLSSVKIGEIYMSRLIIEPNVTTGNYYHKKNRLMFYVERGEVLSVCEHILTKERKEINLRVGKQIIHIPSMIALSNKNVGKEDAVVVFFSNYPIRDPNDCFDYEVLKRDGV